MKLSEVKIKCPNCDEVLTLAEWEISSISYAMWCGNCGCTQSMEDLEVVE